MERLSEYNWGETTVGGRGGETEGREDTLAKQYIGYRYRRLSLVGKRHR